MSMDANNAQLVAAFMNLNLSFTNLYELKFKGKKLMEEVANCYWEQQLMGKSLKQSLSYGERLIYDSAISSCSELICTKLSQFQEQCLKKYMANMGVVIKNKDYLQLLDKGGAVRALEPGEVLVVELVELGVSLSQQYDSQMQLILRHWQAITSNYLAGSLEGEQVKELMLHIGFESEVENSMQQAWKGKIFALSNQRYNSKKN